MIKEYLDKNRLKIEFHKLGHYTDQVCKEFLVHNVNKLINQICQIKPKNQVVIAEGRFIISNGKEFGISQRACYIKLSPRKLIGIGALGRRLKERGVEGKKVLIILEEVDENQRTI